MEELTPQTSPVLRAIRHITRHPAEGQPPADTSRLLHALNIITGKAPAEPSPKGIASPLKSRKAPTSASAADHVAIISAVALSMIFILAASKYWAVFESVRDAIQHWWAVLERRVLKGKNTTIRATKTASKAVKAHSPAAKRELQRFAPAVLGLVAVSLLAQAHHKGELRNFPTEVQRAQHRVQAQLPALDRSRPGFVRKSAAFIATLGVFGVAQCVTAHKPALGAPDPYKRTRLYIQHHSRAARETMDAMLRCRVLHISGLSILAVQAFRHLSGSDCSYRGLALAACSAVASEHVLRCGTSRKWPGGGFTVRLRRAAAGRVHPNRLVLPAAVLLTTGAVLVAGGRAQKVEEAVEYEFKAISEKIRAKGLDRVLRPAMQPPLLLVAMMGCDLAMQENSLLRRVTPRGWAAVQQRAPPVPVPGPFVITGSQIKQATVTVWNTLASGMAHVPARLPRGRERGEAKESASQDTSGAQVGRAAKSTGQPKGERDAGASGVSHGLLTDSDAQAANSEANAEESVVWSTAQENALPLEAGVDTGKGSDADGFDVTPVQTVISVDPVPIKTPDNAVEKGVPPAIASPQEQDANIVGAVSATLYQELMEPWMMESLASACLVPQSSLTEISDESFEKLQAAREERLRPLHDELHALVEALPLDLESAAAELYAVKEGSHLLDQGGRGLPMLAAKKAAQLWRDRLDYEPGQSLEEDVLPELASAVAAVAHRSSADPADCFPTSSPADALTALLHTIKPSPDASVLILSAADRVTKAAVGRCAATAGLSIIEVQINKDALLDVSFLERQMESALKAAGGAVKAAVIPHVPSFPPVVLPVADLVAKCKEHKALTLVDGTQALGNIALDIPALGADAYIASCSTWLSAAGSSAFTWVDKALQADVAPLVALQRTGFGIHADSLLTGPADVCAWLSVHSALAVIDKYGDTEVRARRQAVLKLGTSALLSSFRSQYSSEDGELPALVSGELQASGSSTQAHIVSISKDEQLESTIEARNMPGMAAVRLPNLPAYDVSPRGAHALRKVLRRRGIEVQVVAWESALWLRVSSALYNSVADFEALASAISDISGHHAAKNGKHKSPRKEVNGKTGEADKESSE